MNIYVDCSIKVQNPELLIFSLKNTKYNLPLTYSISSQNRREIFSRIVDIDEGKHNVFINRNEQRRRSNDSPLFSFPINHCTSEFHVASYAFVLGVDVLWLRYAVSSKAAMSLRATTLVY